MNVVRLQVGAGPRLRAIRLRALAEAPQAFESTLAEATARPLESWDRQLDAIATFVATAGGNDLRLARGCPHEHLGGAASLISMWVAPEARRQGTGAALVDAVIAWARAQGYRRLLLDVREKSTPAIALYTHKGFLQEATIAPPPPADARICEIQMALTL